MKKEKIAWMESLRGVACLIVLVAHIISTNEVFGNYANGCGKIGVWLFFLFGAFWVIFPSCQKKIEQPGKWIKRYYWNRFIKLYPVFLIVVCMAALSGLISFPEQLLNNLFFLEGTGHLWYMPVIIKFFLIAPAFVFLKNVLSDKWMILFLCVLGVVTGLLFPYTIYVENSIIMWWYVPVLCMGMILAIAFHKCLRDNIKCKWADMFVVGIFVLIFLLTPLGRKCVWGIEPGAYLQNKYLIIGFFWCMLIILVQTGSFWRGILNKSVFLSWVGEISYPLYLIHYFVLMKVGIYISNWWLKSIIVLIISFLLSYIVHKWIEIPCSRKFKIN